MARRALVICLSPPEVCARVIARARSRDGARATALVGRETDAGALHADEVLCWRELGPSALLREIRSRGYDLLVVAHGRDQHLSRAYWLAMGLALASRVPVRAFAEDGGEARPGLARAVIRSIGSASGLLAVEAYAAALGAVLVGALLIGTAIADLGEALATRLGAGGAGRRGKDSSGPGR